MSEKKQGSDTTRARRKLLKLAATGGTAASVTAYSGNWARPVIDSVMLPAHATTTDDSGSFGSGTELRSFWGATTINSPTTALDSDGILDQVIGQAYAGTDQQPLQIKVNVLMVETATPGQYMLKLIFDEPFYCKTQAMGRYVGYVSGLVSGGSGNLSSTACPGTNISNTFTVQLNYSVGANSVNLSGTFFGYIPFALALTLGNTFPSVPVCIECPPIVEDSF